MAPPLVVGFDIETGSANHMHKWREEYGPYVILGGAICNGRTWITRDIPKLVELLHRADFIYGHNIFGFDIPALAAHAGADMHALYAKGIDTLELARLADPPRPKGMVPVRYDLSSVAQRLGVEGKTDSVSDLAARALDDLVEEAVQVLPDPAEPGLTKKEAVARTRDRRRAEKEVRARYKDLGTYHLIDPENPDFTAYLEGDLQATAKVFSRLNYLMRRGTYGAREMEGMRTLHAMAHSGWRVDRSLLERRVAEEEERVEAAKARLQDLAPGVPLDKASPMATKAGKEAMEAALLAAGVAEDHLPRTDTGGLSTARDALSEGDWVRAQLRPVNRFDRKTGEWVETLRKVQVRTPGLRSLYRDNPAVQELCEVATLAGGRQLKYAELLDYAQEDGTLYSRIGQIQVSGRYAMVTPSITNIGKRSEALLRVREVFVPRREDEVIVCADLDQGDMRVVAALCQDPEYMKLFLPGVDAHMETAYGVFGERTKTARKKAKAIGHAANYGGGLETIVTTSGQSKEDVQRYLDHRADAYPVLARWQDAVRREAESGWIEDNGWGRRMACDRRAAFTQGPALYGQSGTREILLDGVLRMSPALRRMLVAIVHDEVVASVPLSDVAAISEEIRSCLETTWRGVAFTAGVSKPGTNWAACYTD